jgi:hypothetical protein
VTVAVVAGALANKPHNGGEAWVRLSWLLGLQRLGVETWFVEEIDADACVDSLGEPAPAERSVNVSWFEDVVANFGLSRTAALLDPGGRSVAGVPAEAVVDAARRADVLINISGNLTHRPLLHAPRIRAYLDLDPGYTQFWHAQDALRDGLPEHDVFLTVALSIGRPSSTLPVAGLEWRSVRPPVVLSEWPRIHDDLDARFTTVGSWRGYGRLQHEGRLYGQKAHEFRRFQTVPHLVDATFEAALLIHPADRADADSLAANGWNLVDPREAAGDPDAFRRYVQGSPAEFSPAQGIYVETGSGWFSDRTTRYLASGRPAVVQETGLPPDIAQGEGLLVFRTLEEAQAGARSVLEDYEKHASAARKIAEDLFDSDIVIGGLLEELVP